MSFNNLGLQESLVQAAQKHNIIEPTKVQEQVIPIILKGKDVLCQSETGSGKTISFALPIIDQLEGKGGARVLVVAPTRELAKQIAEEFEKFSAHKRLKIMTVYGGVALGPQIDKIPRTDVIVGTPGRILDLFKQGYLKLDLIKYLVLDECDRMFDMGFIDDIHTIMTETPEQKQVLLFSATVDTKVKEVSAKYMHNPEHIRVTPHLVKGALKQSYYVCPHNQKISMIVHLLRTQEFVGERAIIFTRTKRLADMVSKALRQNKFNAEALHGDMTQAKRERVIDNFGKGKVDVVVATDVASRGIHVDDVRYVYNYNLPEETETYVHRVGRTARNGKPGDAVTLLSDDEYRLFDNVMHHFNGEIEKGDPGHVPKVMFRKDDDEGRGRSMNSRSFHGRSGGEQGFSRGRDRGPRSSAGGNRNGGNSSFRSGRSSEGRSSGAGRPRESGRSGGPGRGQDARRNDGARASDSRRDDRPRTSAKPRSSGPSLADLD